MAQVSLGHLWRTRQWRRLLNLIENLPAASKYQEAISKDEEYLRAVVQANGGQLPKSKSAPPLSEWTLPVSYLAILIDEIRALKAITIKVNSDPKKTSSPRVEQMERPATAWQAISFNERLRKHHRLTDRLLGNRRKKVSSA